MGCTLVGCSSSVSFLAHLNETPETLHQRGSFHVCKGGKCWDGTFNAPAGAGVRRTWACNVPTSSSLRMRCDLVPEGAGSRLTLDVVGDPPFADGDRVSLRVVVGEARVIDHVRTVRYHEFKPNGPRCGPTCRVANVELWPGAPSNVSCPSAMCNPIVRFKGTLPQTREGAGHTKITACKNGECQSAEVGPFWEWSDEKNQSIPISNGGVGVPPVGGSSVYATAYSLGGGAPYDVTVEFRGDPRTYRDGDVYSFEWTSMTGQVLLSERRVVTAYDEDHPGGVACSPVACRSKVFEK
jgi:hypothetical protein